jgi:FixJ family two-component response regulator
VIPHLSERGLILAPLGRDAHVAAALLAESKVRTVICGTLDELVDGLKAGAGFALLTEEALHTSDLHSLAEWIRNQPEWSDFPFVLLTQRGGGIERNPLALRFLGALGNVTFLERPFHPTSLLSIVASALRGRRRQYDARARLEALADLNATLGARVDAAVAQHKLLADIVESTDALVQVVDPDFRLIAINRASANEFERGYGVRPKVGDSILDLLRDSPVQRAAMKAVWTRALAGEQFTEILRLGEPERGPRYFEMKFNTLYDHEGKRIGA